MMKSCQHRYVSLIPPYHSDGLRMEISFGIKFPYSVHLAFERTPLPNKVRSFHPLRIGHPRLFVNYQATIETESHLKANAGTRQGLIRQQTRQVKLAEVL